MIKSYKTLPMLLSTILGGSVLFAPQFACANGLQEVTLKTAISNQPDQDKFKTGSVIEQKQSISDQSILTSDDAPLLISVSLDDQQLSIYRGTRLVQRSRISSGKKGHRTPMGVFSILEKRKYHKSNIYSSAPMPYMQRLTWSGIALHESNSVPRHPASHGCVRLPKGFSKELYDQTRYGTHVIIAPEEVVPRPVNHPSLFQPVKAEAEIASLRPSISNFAASKPKDETNDKPLRIYATRTTLKDQTKIMQKLLIKLGYGMEKADGIYGKQTIAAVKRFQLDQDLPRTGTMTKAVMDRLYGLTGSKPLPAGRIYVRKDHLPIYQASYEIKQPTKPLGTHLLTLTGFNGEQAIWTNAALSSKIKSSVLKTHKIDEANQMRVVRTGINQVLDRLVFDAETRQFISQNLTEHSSFAISDNGIGTETGKGTDFIVQTY